MPKPPLRPAPPPNARQQPPIAPQTALPVAEALAEAASLFAHLLAVGALVAAGVLWLAR